MGGRGGLGAMGGLGGPIGLVARGITDTASRWRGVPDGRRMPR
jgi:hypothetical protein